MEAARILRDALEGCDEALRVLVRNYHDRVYRLGCVLCADELAQVRAHDDDASSALALLDRWHVIHEVHRAIAALPSAWRQVLLLREIEGLSSAEVARLLQLSETELSERLHNARNTMRAQLTGQRGTFAD
jgi:DNA-directed RNA polymerase specialized sigma24 family protein